MHQHETRLANAALIRVALMLVASALFAGCSSFAPRPAVPIAEITRAAQAGQSSDQIISSIRTNRTNYALRGSDFVKLAERGVPEPVLDELQQQFFSQVQLMTKRWYIERISGGPTELFAQPVDLDNLDRGGNGMAPTTKLGRVTSLQRPPGVPAWVPANPASPFAASISVKDVLQMAKQGQPAEKIVATIRDSHIQPLYSDSGNKFARTRTAAITGSEYARLAKQGVPIAVIDALQATYLSDHVEWSRQQYWHMKGTSKDS